MSKISLEITSGDSITWSIQVETSLKAIKVAKYEIQKTSTCRATLFRCLFLVDVSVAFRERFFRRNVHHVCLPLATHAPPPPYIDNGHPYIRMIGMTVVFFRG